MAILLGAGACGKNSLHPRNPPNTPQENLCGNGQLNTGERCDDSNNKDGDGCSASCTIEKSEEPEPELEIETETDNSQ